LAFSKRLGVSIAPVTATLSEPNNKLFNSVWGMAEQFKATNCQSDLGVALWKLWARSSLSVLLSPAIRILAEFKADV
jgi:hypothetical protein